MAAPRPPAAASRGRRARRSGLLAAALPLLAAHAVCGALAGAFAAPLRISPAPSRRAGPSTVASSGLPAAAGAAPASISKVARGIFGPGQLKGFAKEAGKAAGDLKEVPEAFQDGVNAAAKAKGEADPKKEDKKDDKKEKEEKKEEEKKEA